MNPANDTRRAGGGATPPTGLFIGPLAIIIVAGYAYYLSLNIDEAPPGQLGAAFWPRMSLLLLCVSCVWKMLESYLAWRKEGAAKAEAEGQVDHCRLWTLIVLMALCVLAMELIGFPLANLFFMLAYLWFTGERRPVPLVATSVLGTVGLLYLFVKVVYLPLPKGDWIFDEITIFIYRALGIL